jgi:hypothetical protein
VGINLGALLRTDAFVSVSITYGPYASDLPLLPIYQPGQHWERIGLQRFGVRVASQSGKGADGAQWHMFFWIGPRASAKVRSQTLSLLTHVRLPWGQPFDCVPTCVEWHLPAQGR